MPKKVFQTLSGEVVQVTAKSVLFENDANGLQTWIPRCVCIDGDVLNVGDIDVIIATWWLELCTR